MRTSVVLASLLTAALSILPSLSFAQTIAPVPPAPAVSAEPPPPVPMTLAIPEPPPEAPPPAPTPPAPVAQPKPQPSPGFYAVPRTIFLTVGWSYTPTNSLPVATQVTQRTPMGVNLDTGLMWQVRGFDGIRWPAWVGFMAGFMYYGGQTGVADTYGLSYGIFVKHALWPGRRLRLWGGYGLGAAQVWIRDLDGRGAGHYTRLSLGFDTHLVRWLHLTLEFSYRFFNLPTFKFSETDSGGYDFHALSVLAGFWFGR